MPLMNAIMRQPELWNQDMCRTTFDGTPHSEVDDIILRFGGLDGDDLQCYDRSIMTKLPGAKQHALRLLYALGGSQLGRVVITRLQPGHKILPHADTMGEYAKFYSRYHIVLQGFPGSLFTCGDETVNMLSGETWWFDPSAEHSVKNNSQDDRVHMLVDIRIDQ